jgi:hypothetical protein
MSILWHCLVYIPITMAAGAYVWVKRVALKEVLSALLLKLKHKSGS